jgi:hypothetical protein
MRDDWKHRLERNLGPRLVLGSGVPFGLVMAARYALGVNAAMRGVNFHVYYLAAEAALHGEPLYAVAAPGFPGLPWVYPPVVSVAFAPYLAVGDWQAAFALHTLTGVAAGAATGVVLARFVARQGRELTRTDRALVVAFGAVSVHAVPSLFFGNVNPHLAFALAAGIAGLDEGRSRLAGVGFALPAVVKVFPAAFGLWLVSRRDWRAVGAAVATGAAAAAASFGAFGVDAHVAYVREALLPRLRHEAFAAASTRPRPTSRCGGRCRWRSRTLSRRCTRSARSRSSRRWWRTAGRAATGRQTEPSASTRRWRAHSSSSRRTSST